MSLSHLLHLKQFGYAGIFLSLALGILGVPIPDEAIMTFLGYLIHTGKLLYVFCFISSFFGSITGMSLSYLIGRGLLSKVEERFEKKFNLKDKREKIELLFNKYGNVIIIFVQPAK